MKEDRTKQPRRPPRPVRLLQKQAFAGEGGIGDKLCYSVRPQKCIDITRKPVALGQRHCLHYGQCAEACPKPVIEKRF